MYKHTRVDRRASANPVFQGVSLPQASHSHEQSMCWQYTFVQGVRQVDPWRFLGSLLVGTRPLSTFDYLRSDY